MDRAATAGDEQGKGREKTEKRSGEPGSNGAMIRSRYGRANLSTALAVEVELHLYINPISNTGDQVLKEEMMESTTPPPSAFAPKTIPCSSPPLNDHLLPVTSPPPFLSILSSHTIMFALRRAVAAPALRRGYAEAVSTSSKLKLSLVLPHQVRRFPAFYPPSALR
jgi:hypothetical protein